MVLYPYNIVRRSILVFLDLLGKYYAWDYQNTALKVFEPIIS
jgi:hypothetical protein